MNFHQKLQKLSPNSRGLDGKDPFYLAGLILMTGSNGDNKRENSSYGRLEIRNQSFNKLKERKKGYLNYLNSGSHGNLRQDRYFQEQVSKVYLLDPHEFNSKPLKLDILKIEKPERPKKPIKSLNSE